MLRNMKMCVILNVYPLPDCMDSMEFRFTKGLKATMNGGKIPRVTKMSDRNVAMSTGLHRAACRKRFPEMNPAETEAEGGLRKHRT